MNKYRGKKGEAELKLKFLISWIVEKASVFLFL